MRYAKLIDGVPSYAPNPIKHNGLWYGNPPAEIYAAEGYKPVVLYDEPDPLGDGHWEEAWNEDNLSIYMSWVWHEATDEDELSDSEALNILTGGDSG